MIRHVRAGELGGVSKWSICAHFMYNFSQLRFPCDTATDTKALIVRVQHVFSFKRQRIIGSVKQRTYSSLHMAEIVSTSVSLFIQR